jgi:hypothetical protein
MRRPVNRKPLSAVVHRALALLITQLISQHGNMAARGNPGLDIRKISAQACQECLKDSDSHRIYHVLQGLITGASLNCEGAPRARINHP